MKNLCFLIWTLCIAVMGCTSQQKESTLTKDDIASIQLLGKQYNEGLNKSDWKKITGIYSEDAIRFPPDPTELIQKGKKEILDHHAQLFTSDSTETRQRPADFKYEYETKELLGLGNIAYEIGNWKVSFTDIKSKQFITDGGGCMSIFKKTSEGWRIHREMWTDLNDGDYGSKLKRVYNK